jgi:hypothetical protein
MSAFLLLACQMTAPGAGPQGVRDDAIAVTPLDAPGAPAVAPARVAAQTAAPDTVVAEAATKSTPHPKPRPAGLGGEAAVAAAAVEPQASTPAEDAAPKSPEQMLCEKAKGQWASAGDTGAYYCASTTRDGGKLCTRKTQCEGQCLARSGTCAPITPLYGCNDIFEKDGRQVTLCID